MISTFPRSSKRAFSLIEVAFALAIFVIGALAIIKIFPGALNVINNNGDQQVATNLNRSALARLKSENAVPGATFNLKREATTNNLVWNANSADHSITWSDSPTAVIGIPRFNYTLPTTQDINTVADESALSRYRAIQGEQAKVIELTVGTTTNKYALTQFPISVQTEAGQLTPIFPTISQELILQNVRIDRQGTLDFSQATRPDGTPLTQNDQVNPGSVIYVSYHYWNNVAAADRRFWGINEEAIPIPTTPATPITLTSATGIKVSPPTATTAARGAMAPYNVTDAKSGVVAEILSVRVKNFIGIGDFDGPIIPPPSPPTSEQKVPDARRGMVKLPANVDISKPVSIDYVADWSMLLQDGAPLLTPDATPPAPAPTPLADQNYRQIALGTPFIEDRTNIGIYSLLLTPAPSTSTGLPNFTSYRSRFGVETPDPLATDRLVKPTEDELRAGKVTFVADTSASRARVSYRTRDSWTQQLSVASSSYKPHALAPATTPGGALSPVEPWRDYYLGNDNYLYFHAGEAGKAINISYSYNDVTDSGTPTPLPDIQVKGRPYVIEEELVSATGLGLPTSFVGASSKVARAKLLTATGQSFPATKNTAPINLVSIQSVTGTGVTLRTAYINGDRYAQTLLTANRNPQGLDQ